VSEEKTDFPPVKGGQSPHEENGPDFTEDAMQEGTQSGELPAETDLVSAEAEADNAEAEADNAEAEADNAEERSSDQILILQKKVKELEDSILRTRAEAENARKRAVKDVESAHRYGNEKVIREILPVKDSLEMGWASVQDSEEVASLAEGLSLTLKMFDDFLERIEVKEIDPVEEMFDPGLHQAMATEPSETAAPGTVLKVFQKGYLLHDRLVRPALVVVSAKKSDE